LAKKAKKREKEEVFSLMPLSGKKVAGDCDLWSGNDFKWPTKMLSSAIKKTEMTPLMISTQNF